MISKAFQITYICALLFSQFFILVYLCADHFLSLLYSCFYWWILPVIIFLFLVMGFYFMFSICCKAGLVVLNCLSLCFSLKLCFCFVLFFLCQIWRRAFLGQIFLVVNYFPFISLNILCHSLLSCREYSC